VVNIVVITTFSFCLTNLSFPEINQPKLGQVTSLEVLPNNLYGLLIF